MKKISKTIMLAILLSLSGATISYADTANDIARELDKFDGVTDKLFDAAINGSAKKITEMYKEGKFDNAIESADFVLDKSGAKDKAKEYIKWFSGSEKEK